MGRVIIFIIGVLKITLLDLTLSGDNISIIALATKNLPQTYARRAGKIGICLAVSFIIFFECFVTIIISIKWLPIKLIGGLLLMKITWDFIKPHDESNANIKIANKFLEAIFIIVIADISMSLDNVLAIAGAANGNLLLIVFGVALNIPVLIFGSQLIVKLIKKYPIFVYIGGAILAHTSILMILEDPLLNNLFNGALIELFSWFIALLVLVYGYIIIGRNKIFLAEASCTKIEEDKN